MKKAILAYLNTNPPQGHRTALGIALRVTSERPATVESRAPVNAALGELIAEGKIIRVGNGRSHAYMTTERAIEMRKAYEAAVQLRRRHAPVS